MDSLLLGLHLESSLLCSYSSPLRKYYEYRNICYGSPTPALTLSHTSIQWGQGGGVSRPLRAFWVSRRKLIATRTIPLEAVQSIHFPEDKHQYSDHELHRINITQSFRYACSQRVHITAKSPKV